MPRDRRVQFALIGDQQYTPVRQKLFENVIDAMNKGGECFYVIANKQAVKENQSHMRDRKHTCSPNTKLQSSQGCEWRSRSMVLTSRLQEPANRRKRLRELPISMVFGYRIGFAGQEVQQVHKHVLRRKARYLE